MGFAMSAVKLTVFIFNLVFALAGLLLIIMGALVLAKMKSFVDELDDGKFGVPAIVAIVIGSIVFILAFLGCCGAARESHGMLISYAVLLCCVFVVEVAIASLAFVYRGEFETIVKEDIQTWYEDYNTDKDKKALVDDIQQVFQCCGMNGPQTFLLNVPPSCCNKDTTTNCTLLSPGLYKRGCLSAITDLGSWAGNVVGWVAIGICVVEIVGIIFACCLANSIKNESRRRYA